MFTTGTIEMMGSALEPAALIAFFGLGAPGVGEMIVIGVLAVLLFGSKLPEVARSLGNSYQQFRKGLSDIQSSIKTDIDLNSTLDRIPDYSDVVDDLDEPSAPKFEPPPRDEPRGDELPSQVPPVGQTPVDQTPVAKTNTGA